MCLYAGGLHSVTALQVPDGMLSVYSCDLQVPPDAKPVRACLIVSWGIAELPEAARALQLQRHSRATLC